MIVNVIHDTDHVLVPKGDPNEKELHEHLDIRYDNLQKEIEIQGLEVKYWPAVKDPLNRVFVAIAQAHKQIIGWAKAQGFPSVCVAEDDVSFFAPGAWAYYLSKMPEDFDLYLGNVFHGLQEDGTAIDFCGLGLYVCHERFYDTFLTLPDLNHIDRSLAGKGRYVVCDPMVCTQRAGYSWNKRVWDSYDRYLVGRRLFGREVKG
jgi:hypothetical protein